jgi:hypothetical protein
MQTEPDRHGNPPARRSALEECEDLIAALDREARKHQTLAWTSGLLIVLASSSIPVLILISTQTGGFVFGKLLPALLAAVAAIAAGAAQIVRPHDHWRIHRRWQRWLEAERLRYLHGLNEYASSDRDRLLMKRIVSVRRRILEEWEAMMPPDGPQAAAELPRIPPAG